MAGGKYMKTAKKLQTACKKVFGVKLLIDQRQWYHKDKDMAVTCYTLYQAKIVGNRTEKTELFKTYSQIQLVLFLRDFWYELNGWEVPTDNLMWEELKRQYGKRKAPTETDPETVPPAGSEAEAGRETVTNRTTICDELYTGWQRNRSVQNDS